MRNHAKWKGRVALVTGASAGIGKAIALALGKEGMKVALVARRKDRLSAVKQEIERCGGTALSCPADLRDEQQLLGAFRQAKATFGGIDVLVNSAGLGHVAPLMSGKTEFFRNMLEVNVLALAVATRCAIEDMVERKAAGHIIHIASMSSYRVQTGAGMYAATKFAVRALTEGLRRELREARSPIRVTAVSPADTETEFNAHHFGSEEEALRHAPPYAQMKPEDIADAVLYILSTPDNVEVHDILLRPIGQPD
jgi:17beta-estradiol 17-dehydrogenase / 3beta-hydroxysteroid 3-dehydrogenase